jgi:sec-independent protein translocase protein TatC
MAAKEQERSAEMPFLDHLEELRWRIIWSLGAMLIGVAVGFLIVSKFDLILFLEQPILPYLSGRKLVYTHPGDPFQIFLNAALIIGAVFASPLIIYQIWAFLSPGLYKHERHIAIGVLFAGIALFAAGAAMAFLIVIPLSLPWLMGFGGTALEPMITASDYFGFVFGMVLTFGISFELPMVILALSAFGIVTPQLLSKFRRHAIVLIVVVGAFLTPGDLISTTIALAVPLYLLYELSVLASHVIYRKRLRSQAAAAAESARDAEGEHTP